MNDASSIFAPCALFGCIFFKNLVLQETFQWNWYKICYFNIWFSFSITNGFYWPVYFLFQCTGVVEQQRVILREAYCSLYHISCWNAALLIMWKANSSYRTFLLFDSLISVVWAGPQLCFKFLVAIFYKNIHLLSKDGK